MTKSIEEDASEPEHPWDPEEVQDQATKSGRPLEVESALAFLGAGWHVQLGQYFFDQEAGKAKEGDVIASKARHANLHGKRIVCGMDVFVSCKGFKDNERPLLYSLSDRTLHANLGHQLIYTRNGLRTLQMSLGCRAATTAVFETGIDPARRIVAFDILKRDELTSKEKDKRGLDPTVAHDYERVTNKDLFEGLTSAFKAALFWSRIQEGEQFYAMLRVPLLITSKPWLEVSLDGGKPGKHTDGTKGINTIAYPHHGGGSAPESISTLLCAVSELPKFITGLEAVYTWFLKEQNLTWVE
jgi:hypothetical protein